MKIARMNFAWSYIIVGQGVIYNCFWGTISNYLSQMMHRFCGILLDFT